MRPPVVIADERPRHTPASAAPARPASPPRPATSMPSHPPSGTRPDPARPRDNAGFASHYLAEPERHPLGSCGKVSTRGWTAQHADVICVQELKAQQADMTRRDAGAMLLMRAGSITPKRRVIAALACTPAPPPAQTTEIGFRLARVRCGRAATCAPISITPPGVLKPRRFRETVGDQPLHAVGVELAREVRRRNSGFSTRILCRIWPRSRPRAWRPAASSCCAATGTSRTARST